MLSQAPAEVEIESSTGDYNIGNGILHARVLYGPRFRERARPPRCALFLHGGELGVNHSLVERPARWLIARDLFDEIILPDRRGSGASSVLGHPISLDEQADDLRRLLDRMNIPGPLAALGVDIGGPIALVLAGLDPRVGCVVLVASAPERREITGLVRLAHRLGLLRPLIDREIRRSIGRQAGAGQVDFDACYDAPTPMRMSDCFRALLRSIPSARFDSLRNASLADTDPALGSAPARLALNIPVLQLIGEVDEVWGGPLRTEVQRRFPNFTRRVVPGASIHRDVYFQAEAFTQALIDLLKESCPQAR